jgi:hypothetical protein
MEDDNRSVASAGSVASTAQAKVACPHCSKDFQKRGIFKHIRLNHYKEFLLLTSERWVNEAARGEPLRIEWEGEDDHGEPIPISVWVCLATYRSFLLRHRAVAHLAKDHSARKIHDRELVKLKKDLQSAQFRRQQEYNNNAIVKSYKSAVERNCPELARILWRRIDYETYSISLIVSAADELMKLEIHKDKNLDRIIEKHLKMSSEIEALESAKCLDVKTLLPYYEGTIMVRQFLYNKFWTFDEFNDLRNGERSIQPKHAELSEDMYFFAGEHMPPPEF